MLQKPYGEWIHVRGRLPRKQGLKPTAPLSPALGISGPRATSTKTRIETQIDLAAGAVDTKSEGDFHENKD